VLFLSPSLFIREKILVLRRTKNWLRSVTTSY